MQLLVPLLPVNSNLNLAAVTCGIAGVVVASIVIVRLSQSPKLDAFPTVRSKSWLSSWWDDRKYMINANEMAELGCNKYKSAPFRIADHYRWIVVLRKREHIEDVLNAPEEVMSVLGAADEALNLKYTTGHDIRMNPSRARVVFARLTRQLATIYPEIRDEIVTAFDEILDIDGKEWKGVPVLVTMQNIVCRTNGRIFVNLPLCRDPDYVDLNIQFARDAFKAGATIGMFPEFMKPLVANFCTSSVARGKMRARKLLSPLIEERLSHVGSEEWKDKPNDILSWLIEESDGSELTVDSLVMRVVALNFAAVHASASKITYALYCLAAYPQYIQPLRKEVESIVEKEGWSKAAVAKMHKLNSFLTESVRIEAHLAVQRKAMKDFTLSDGTFIPKGTTIAIAIQPFQRGDETNSNANVFKPFPLDNMRGEDETGNKYRFASTALGNLDYLPFGHGKLACPGRFFAETELKTILAHIVMTYDIKLEDSKLTPPPSLHFGTMSVANPFAKILFRKRGN